MSCWFPWTDFVTTMPRKQSKKVLALAERGATAPDGDHPVIPLADFSRITTL